MNTVLEAAQVSMAVGHATLLNRVDLRIHSGETLAIVGPNGAGKSTLLRLLSADLMPSAGTVRLQGRDLRAYAPARLALLRAMLS
jgi:iron complex transport system ATP-binding protein